MPSAPTAATWVDQEIPTVDTMNARLYSVWNFLLNPPMCKLRQHVVQSIPNQTYTAITWDSEDVDTHGFHSTTVNPSRITPTVPGYYVGAYGASFGVGATGRRLITLRKNGGQVVITSSIPHASSNLVLKGFSFGPVFMNGSTDYFDVAVWHAQGAAINTAVGGSATDYEEDSEFYVRWWSS